jgi:hypothetical protein
MRLISTLVIALSLTGCWGKISAPRPPTWEVKSCTPDDDYYLELAQDDTHLTDLRDISRDPEVAVLQAKDILEDWSVAIIPKAKGIEEWSRFSTTFPTAVYVAEGFDRMPSVYQAIILWHEIVHLRQYQALTPKVFYDHYLFSEGRWALEVQAYREDFRLIKKFSPATDAELLLFMQYRAESLYSQYKISMMPQECAIRRAIDIWSMDL